MSDGMQLVRGGRVLAGIAADGTPEIIDDGAVLVEGGNIVAIDGFGKLGETHPRCSVIGSMDDVVTPGLINAHHHSGITPFQLGIPDMPLELWLGAKIGQRGVDPYLDTLHSAFEMIASGVTTVQHLNVSRSNLAGVETQTRAILAAYADIGMRVSYSYGYRDQNRLAYETDAAVLDRLEPGLRADANDWFEWQHIDLADYLGFVEQLADGYAGTDGRIAVQLAPSNLHWCSDEALLAISELSKRRKLPMHMHLLETAYQAAYAEQRSAGGAVEHLHRLGLLGPLLTLGHGVWLDDAALDLVAGSGTCMCHNPSSNLRLGSGTAPCRHMLARNIPVALGIDEAGINDDRDMLQEMRLAALLHRSSGIAGTWIGAAEIFRMATEHGAATTPFAGRIGRLAPGMAADLVLFDGRAIAGPYLDKGVSLPAAIVQRARQQAVRSVMIAGRVVYADGRFLLVDQEAAATALRESLQQPQTAEEDARRRLAERLVPALDACYNGENWAATTARLRAHAERTPRSAITWGTP